MLEPDNTREWTGTAVRNAMIATGRRLARYGFAPRFIAPSTTSMANAPLFTQRRLTAPRGSTHLDAGEGPRPRPLHAGLTYRNKALIGPPARFGTESSRANVVRFQRSRRFAAGR